MTSSNSKLDFVLFGVGRIGICHLRSITRHPRIRLKYLMEQDISHAQTVLDSIGLENVLVRPLSEIDEVLADTSVKGVIICTPTPTHQDLITRSLRAGKPVFCEKPIAPDLAAAEECYDVAEECQLPLFCALNRRFDPHFAEVIRRAQAGDVGKLRYIKTTMRDTLDPNFSGLSHLGSIFLDLGLHDIDTVCMIAGELPLTVCAQGHAFVPQIANTKDYDQAVITLKFPSGVIAHIELSRFCHYGYDQRLEVFGMSGMLDASNVHTRRVSCSNNNGIMQDTILPSFPERYEASFYNEMDHFVKVIEGEVALSVTREHALSAIRITELCEKAAKTGTIIKMVQ